MRPIPVLLAALALLPPRPARSNDGAAAIGAGGVELRSERRVAMVSERLTIAKSRVTVAYAFRNVGPEDVVTEVAFPVPEYDVGVQLRATGEPLKRVALSDFSARVDGAPIPVTREVRARVGARDVTALLREHHVDVETFGHHDGGDGPEYQVRRLPPETRAKLEAEGVVDAGDERPRWTVAVTYHWTQRFPAGKTVRIEHAYTPVTGAASLLDVGQLATSGLPDACLDAATLRALIAPGRFRDGYVAGPEWVEYVLTTANTWRTPIADFELEVERDPGALVSFCWDGPVEKVSPTRFRARVKDFLPRRELTVFFFPPR